MQLEIKEIGDVISGYTFRGPVEFDRNGGTLVVQAKNVVSGEAIEETKALISISTNIPRSASYLQNGDIVIVSRGMGPGTFRSAVFLSEETNVIASSSVHIIRIKKANVLTEFISLYLNSPGGQDALSRAAFGSNLQTIPRRVLEELKVPVPPMKTQETIVGLARNISNQERLLKKKMQLESDLLSATLRSLSTKK